MRTLTASPNSTPHHVDAGAAMVLTADRPQYRHVGDGKFEPCNDAAWIECQRWNAYADAWNARTAGRNAL